MKVQVEVVTPHDAEVILKSNDHNRPLRRAKVEALKRDLKNGKFVISTDAIAIGEDGILWNGQHRLTAIMESGVSADLLVARGVSSDIMPILDTGTARGLHDILHLRGEVNATQLASLLRFMVLLDSGRIYATTHDQAVTSQEAIAYLDEHPEMRHYAQFSRRYHNLPASPTAIAATLVLIDRATGDRSLAAEFMDKVLTRVNEPKGSAVHALSSRLTRARARREHIPTRNLVYAFITAWNKWVIGQSVTQIRVAPYGNAEFRIPAVVVP